MADFGTSIGLDIDDKSVKFVKIKQTNGDITLLKYSVKDIPASNDKVKTVSDILKELFKGEKSDTEVYTCASGQNVSLKKLTLPNIPEEEIEHALKWEMKNLVPFPIDNAQVAYYKLGKISEGANEKTELMAAVASEEHMRFLTALSKESGVKYTGISIVPFALSSFLERSKKLDENHISAIIDIGAETASINLFKGRSLNFTREISVAGDSITKAMTGLLVADHWQVNLTYEQAEDIKKKHGIPEKGSSENTESGIPLEHIHEMIAPTLRRLQNEIIRSFDYYKEEFRQEKIDRIFLTGGSSSLKNLDDFLTKALGIKVENMDPFEGIKIDPSSGIKADELNNMVGRLSLALGLALDKAGKINLLPKKTKPIAAKFDLSRIFKQLNIKMPEGAKLDVKLPANSLVIAVSIFVIAAISYNLILIKERNTFRGQLATKQLLLQDIKTLAEKRQIADQISKEETQVRGTLSQITGILPSGITLIDLSYDNTQRRVLITGQAGSTSQVGKMIKNFEDSPNFKKTVLIEARKTVVDGNPRVLFKISFILT